jgi:hypothetical protein
MVEVSQEEREHLVAQIRARQERLRALAEQARAVRRPPAANAPNDGSIALGDGSSLRRDPETSTWHFRANPDAEPVAVQFDRVRYSVVEAPTVVVDADKGTFSVELPRSPSKLSAATAPSQLLRRALSRLS